MPSSERRGQAYQCKHCPWKGEIKAALEHACKHVEVSPFHCVSCDFKAVTEQAVKTHEETKRHRQKVEGYVGEPVTYKGRIDLEKELRKMSQEESVAHWKSRERSVTLKRKSSTAKEKAGTSDPGPSNHPGRRDCRKQKLP